jgi:hypothetical protein
VIRESFRVIRESFRVIRESFRVIRESFRVIRESFRVIRESFRVIRESFRVIRSLSMRGSVAEFLNQAFPLAYRRCLGSSASRKPSPRKFSATSVKLIANAGNKSSHQ